MIKDGMLISDDVISSNIARLTERQSRLEEQRICELSPLAFEAAELFVDMTREGFGVYESLSVISDGLSSPIAMPHSNALPENFGRLTNYLAAAGIYDKIVFTELIAEKISALGEPLSEKDFLPEFLGKESFTYVKNPLADEAYDVFSQDFLDPRVVYSPSLAEAARAVSTGEFTYALLPLEEHGGARLSSVAEILFKEDLKINSVTPVFGFDGVADMKYALVSKHFKVPEFLLDDDRYLEIRLRADSSVPLSELLLAAEALGSTLYRVNSISFDTEDGVVQYYSVVFRDEGKDFSALLVFLTLFSGAYTPIGIYKNLE